jgi:DNA primase catalytic core
MARIKDSSVEEVRQVADIVELVGARTQLRRAGSRLTGRCPFHEERTPSFSVNPQDKLYYCFGCGAGGDVITFVRETENLDFAGAVEWLADRFRVQLSYDESSPRADAARRRRKRLFALLERAAGFYERWLWEAESGTDARAYLESRGLGEEICREFRLGLAPGGATLCKRAIAEGYSREELSSAGLANRRGNDYFSGRLLFPLADGRGQVRGFQARKLREDDPLRAKYVNSPEGELFRKGDLLYGLHLARNPIGKQDRAVVVEGNPDVIALRQAGLEPVVASMGTALTERQLRELSRLTRRLFLCFDADAAGQEATLRGMQLAAQQEFEVKVVTLPEGKDPADDPTGFEERLAGALPYVVYRVRIELEQRDRHEAYLRIKDFLDSLPDSPERHDAWAIANDRLGMTIQLRAGRVGAGALPPKLLDASDRLELGALGGARAFPELSPVLAELGPEHFDDPVNQRAVGVVLGVEEPDEELRRLLAALDARADAEGIDLQTGQQLLLRLRERKLQRELADAGDEKLPELQQALAKVRERIREFA